MTLSRGELSEKLERLSEFHTRAHQGIRNRGERSELKTFSKVKKLCTNLEGMRFCYRGRLGSQDIVETKRRGRKGAVDLQLKKNNNFSRR